MNGFQEWCVKTGMNLNIRKSKSLVIGSTYKLSNIDLVNKIYSLSRIRNIINLNCTLTIYKQTILPLLDYTGFMLLSVNISNKSDLQVLQNNALRICYNVRLRDMVSIEHMHTRANLLSLDQRRQKQILFLLFIYKNRHADAPRVYPRNTWAANVFSCVREMYHNVNYRNRPYYKGSLLWDGLPYIAKCCLNITDYKNSLKRIYITNNYSPDIF